MHRRFKVAGLCGLFLIGVPGCASGPHVSAEGMPIKHVVVYRNGVGYFEREGYVDAEKVEFKMRPGNVNDFLATLAVIERGGSSVRAASFPLKKSDAEIEAEAEAEQTPCNRFDARGRPICPPPPPRKRVLNPMATVTLELEGKGHDLTVGYVAETPVWRPSYRLVATKEGIDLQTWGIVQNLSGEDWKDVELSLVAGMPLAFEPILGTPVTPVRPTVTDQGEVIAGVPHGETTLAQEPAAPPPPPMMAAPSGTPAEDYSLSELEEQAYERGADKDYSKRDAKVAKKKAPSSKSAGLGGLTNSGAGYGPGGGGIAAPKSEAARSQQMAQAYGEGAYRPKNVASLARIAVEAGTTRFDIPSKVTVPDRSSTMVMLISMKVPGELMFLFAPDGGVSDSYRHPFRVARFENATRGLLEKGPLAIFEAGSFLGQGMLDPLPAEAKATVPFALERGVSVESTQRSDELGARVAHVEAGVLTIERDSITKTTYKVRNGIDKPAKVMVKHGRLNGTRLHKPPEGTEDNTGTNTALVPIDLAAKKTGELTVEERREFQRTVDWLSQLADDAVKDYLNHPKADETASAALKAAWKIREKLVKAVDDRKKLTDEQREIQKQTEETRANLKVLEKNRQADDLKEKLAARLLKWSNRLDEITKKLVELDMLVNEQRVRFTETLKTIKIDAALKAD
ncbi:MAG: DUF4139 domain-containing protein [Deltaproteobacteria bacterium]|nr:DUF4139 domain-containing protein [Deltaproteobacteria bacterium]